jgi:hypothetical protein
MTYFKIGDKDFSNRVSGLKVKKSSVYNAQTNANGDSVVDYINSKRTIEVGIIPLDASELLEIQAAIEPFNVSLSFMNPETNTLVTGVNCIIPNNDVDYYTIRADKVLTKAMKLTFTEL